MDKLEAAEHLSHLEATIRHKYGFSRADFEACALGARALVHLDTFLEQSEYIRAALERVLGGWEWERNVERSTVREWDASFAQKKVESLRSALSALESLEELES